MCEPPGLPLTVYGPVRSPVGVVIGTVGHLEAKNVVVEFSDAAVNINSPYSGTACRWTTYVTASYPGQGRGVSMADDGAGAVHHHQRKRGDDSHFM